MYFSNRVPAVSLSWPLPSRLLFSLVNIRRIFPTTRKRRGCLSCWANNVNDTHVHSILDTLGYILPFGNRNGRCHVVCCDSKDEGRTRPKLRTLSARNHSRRLHIVWFLLPTNPTSIRYPLVGERDRSRKDASKLGLLCLVIRANGGLRGDKHENVGVFRGQWEHCTNDGLKLGSWTSNGGSYGGCTDLGDHSYSRRWLRVVM